MQTALTFSESLAITFQRNFPNSKFDAGTVPPHRKPIKTGGIAKIVKKTGGMK